MKDFNKDIFKKTVSPFKKWAYVEAVTCFLNWGDLMYWLSESPTSRSDKQPADMMQTTKTVTALKLLLG